LIKARPAVSHKHKKYTITTKKIMIPHFAFITPNSPSFKKNVWKGGMPITIAIKMAMLDVTAKEVTPSGLL
jgi:hypothetical protein